MQSVGSLNKSCKLLWTLCIIVMALSSTVSGGGSLLVRLVEYNNWSGTSDSGECCDALACACDHYFKVCIDTSTSVDNMQRCSIGNVTTGVYANKNVIAFGNVLEGGHSNPLRYNFSRWNVNGIKLKIQVWDRDDNEHDLVDFLKGAYNSMPSRTESEAEWTRVVMTSRTNITLEVSAFCNANWYGPKCDVYCSPPSASSANYECDVGTGRRRCVPGWTGNNCMTLIDMCASSPCQNGASCVAAVNSYSCRCPKGFAGSRCTIKEDYCSSNPCHGAGSRCVSNEDGYECFCSPGNSGTDCSIADPDACGMERCSASGGICTWNGTTGYHCTCKAGWTGATCAINIDECASYPCHGFNSQCEDLENEYVCHCSPGLTGPQCTISDPEACGDHRCYADGGMCTWSYETGTSCQCLPGWHGVSCNESSNVCGKNGDVCLNGGTCVESGSTFTCRCVYGWTGLTCEVNIDDCADNPCHGDDSICVDFVGGYECYCSPGLTGSDCHIPDTDACGPNRCFVDGGDCVWDAPTNYSCVCKPGYSGDECTVHLNECASQPCHGNGSICEDVVNGYKCHCRPGLTGPQCDVIDPEACGPYRCSLEGGFCSLDSFYNYECRCKWGWSGEDCSKNIDECSSNPCNGRGSRCEDLVYGFRCYCSPGLAGPVCSIPDPNACGDKRCDVHGGICTWNPSGDYRCTCKTGWTGIECNVNIEERTSGCNCMQQRVSGRECLERCSSGGSSTTELIFYGYLNDRDVMRVINGIIDHTVLDERIPSSNLSVVYDAQHCVNNYRKPITKFEYLLRRRDSSGTPIKYSSMDGVIEFLPYPVTTDDSPYCRLANDSYFEPVRLSKTSYALPMLVGGVIIFALILLVICFFTTRLYSNNGKDVQQQKSDVEKPKPPCNSDSNYQAANFRQRDDVVVTVLVGDAGNQLRSGQAETSLDEVDRRNKDDRATNSLFLNKNTISNHEDIDDVDIDDAAAERLPLKQKNDEVGKRHVIVRQTSHDDSPLAHPEMFAESLHEMDV